MADKSVDVLMKVVNKGKALDGESGTQFAGAMDSLRTGFTAGKFFELRSFDFSVGSASALKSGPTEMFDKDGNKIEMPKAALKPVDPAALAKVEFVDIQPVSFTRLMDQASTVLFGLLVASQTLDSITVVKRKAAGTRNAGEIFLRLDFTKVLLTELKWKDEEEVVIETGEFIYRELKIQYRPQRDSGSLGALVPAEWKMSA